MGRRWYTFHSPQPDTSRSLKTTDTGPMHRVVCPFTPQLSLVIINRPRRDGTLSWRWYTADVGGIRTHDLAIAVAGYRVEKLQVTKCTASQIAANKQEQFECTGSQCMRMANRINSFRCPKIVFLDIWNNYFWYPISRKKLFLIANIKQNNKSISDIQNNYFWHQKTTSYFGYQKKIFWVIGNKYFGYPNFFFWCPEKCTVLWISRILLQISRKNYCGYYFEKVNNR